MSTQAALVTGANGFIGARLVRKLVERGESVKALVRAGADLRQLADLPADRVKIAVGDARMCDRVYAALAGCDRMYHVASTYSVDERKRQQIVDDALGGTEASLEAARRRGVRKVVVTSSVATLGASKDADELLDESSSFNLEDANCYTAAKCAAEKAALARAADGMPITIVNPAMVVGPGDWKPTPSGVQIVNYLGYSPSLRVPYPVGGFSYVDVDDVAEGHIAAMDKGKTGERYILGGDNLDHRAMFQLLADVTGLAEPGTEMSRGKANFAALLSEIHAGWTGQAPILTRRLVDDYFGKFVFVTSAKAEKELGYRPRPAREAFIRGCRWFLDNGFIALRAARRARLELQPA